MGYESRIYVVNVSRCKAPKTGEDFPICNIIAEMNMSCMVGSFHRLFDKPIDFKIVICDSRGENETDEDCYGDKIKCGDINDIIVWLENEIKRDNYRRLKPLLGLLKGFNPNEWDELKVLHYGY